MAAAGEKLETGGSLFRKLAFGKDAAAHAHHGVGGHHKGGAALPARSDAGGHARLFLRKPQRMAAGRFPTQRRFIEIGGKKFVRLDADLLQQREPTRRGGGEHEPGTPCRGCVFGSIHAESPPVAAAKPLT